MPEQGTGPARYALLTFEEGAAPGSTIFVERGQTLVIGRSGKADYKIDDAKLSRTHVQISFDQENAGVTIRDLGSKNGTFVNGERCKVAMVLDEGDGFAIGQQVFRVSYRHSLKDPEAEDISARLSESISGEADEPFAKGSGEDPVIMEARFCDLCGVDVRPEDLSSGNVMQQEGSYLCLDCAAVVDFHSVELDHYEIVEKLGSGASGAVYKAKDRNTGQLVAVKVLRPGPKVKERRVVRFLREAATISGLSHPNIVRVFDAREFRKGYYLVIEFFEGEDLSELLKRRRFASNELLCSVGIQIARAIDHASTHGVVHRDIKPANILYDPRRGLAKLSDFGLARQMKKQESLRKLTREGEGLGTPTYMPPEQMRNARNVDTRADIYALGATLYHLATGRTPIQARTYGEFVDALMNKDPAPITDTNPAVPWLLCEVIATCMKKSPDDRYANGRELEQQLISVCHAYGLPVPR